MILRLGTENDIPYILAKCVTFHEQSPYRELPFDVEAARDTILDALENGVVVLTDTAFLIGLVIKPHFSSAEIAVEIARWSDAPGRNKIIEEAYLHDCFEYWAKRVGAGFVQDAAFHPTNYFTKRGYTPAEQIYIKRL